VLVFSGYLTYLTVSLPDVGFLRDTNPETTSLMRQRDEESRQSGRTPRLVNHHWVPLAEVSEQLVQAVIVAEDASFYLHDGFDFHEIRESISRNLERGSFVRGASTITQQLAKNLFLSTEKSIHRKIKEALLTRRLERTLSKDRILELYLNVIEWGDGIYGVQAAAGHYFGKTAAQLDAAEGAFLAAMIPSPRRELGERRMSFLKTRQEWILDWMRTGGKLTEEDYVRAKGKKLRLRRKTAPS
jgi:monofunctional biosynthetic peptidoglycan transglycosylase